MSTLDGLLGLRLFYSEGVEIPSANAIDVVGPVLFAYDAALAQVRLTVSAVGWIPISLYDFREVDSSGDVANTAGNGGLLASDTTPILRGDATTEAQEIHWATSNVDKVAFQTSLPPDLDDTADVLLDLYVRTDNSGGGGIDPATFTVETSWNGAALVTDTATDAAPASSYHVVTATVAAADVPASAGVLTCILTPGAHANDPVQLLGARIRYTRKYI
jgi:hypothetical protein